MRVVPLVRQPTSAIAAVPTGSRTPRTSPCSRRPSRSRSHHGSNAYLQREYDHLIPLDVSKAWRAEDGGLEGLEHLLRG
jgi:hypothetical protein